MGYRIAGTGVFALATDMGSVTEEIRAGLLGADAVIIEANHDVEMLRSGPYPFPLKKRIFSDHGHLSNDDCAALAALLEEHGTRYMILGHLSRENNTPARALETVRTALKSRDTVLMTAPPDRPLTLTLTAEETLCSR